MFRNAWDVNARYSDYVMVRRVLPDATVLEKAKQEWYARVRKRNIGVFLGFFGLAASICIYHSDRKCGHRHIVVRVQ